MKRKNYYFVFVLMFGLVSVASGHDYTVGDQELYIMPTADMMPRGASFITDYQLSFIPIFKYTYAPTSSTHIGILTPPPLGEDFTEYVMLHLKQRYLNTKMVRAAAWISFMTGDSTWAFGNVFSIGSKRVNGHLGISYSQGSSDDAYITYFLGARSMVSKTVSFLAEYFSFSFLIDDYGWIGHRVSLATRLHFKKIAIDLGLQTSLEEGGFMPYLKISLLL